MWWRHWRSDIVTPWVKTRIKKRLPKQVDPRAVAIIAACTCILLWLCVIFVHVRMCNALCVLLTSGRHLCKRIKLIYMYRMMAGVQGWLMAGVQGISSIITTASNIIGAIILLMNTSFDKCHTNFAALKFRMNCIYQYAIGTCGCWCPSWSWRRLHCCLIADFWESVSWIWRFLTLWLALKPRCFVLVWHCPHYAGGGISAQGSLLHGMESLSVYMVPFRLYLRSASIGSVYAWSSSA